MKKLVLIGLIVGILLGGGVYVASQKQATTVPSIVQSPITPTPESLLTWTDPAGFTFQYPTGLTIDKHDEDQENYAHVEITNSGHPGSIIVWSKDTTAVDVAAWAKTDKDISKGTILDTTLGKEPAKKILLTTPTRKVVVGTIFDTLLFSVEGTFDDDTYWGPIYSKIVDSYSFVPQEKSGQSTNDTTFDNTEGAVDEEEVVQ